MIVSIPEYKKIYHNKKYKVINEGIIDDFFDDEDNEEENDDSEFISSASAKELQKIYEPKILNILKYLDVQNFEIDYSKTPFLVDVYDHLYLSHKGLNKMGTLMFRFNKVFGNCNFTGNNLTDWSMFPFYIKGNCYANFNNIKNFDDAPIIDGRLIASKQNKKTQYPLTDENYRKFRDNGKVDENAVYIKSVDKFGSLQDINESDNFCSVKLENNITHRYKLDDVEYLGNIENLLL